MNLLSAALHSLLLVQLRSADRVQKRPMLGVDRTYDGHHESDANDPKRTFSDVDRLKLL